MYRTTKFVSKLDKTSRTVNLICLPRSTYSAANDKDPARSSPTIELSPIYYELKEAIKSNKLFDDVGKIKCAHSYENKVKLVDLTPNYDKLKEMVRSVDFKFNKNAHSMKSKDEQRIRHQQKTSDQQWIRHQQKTSDQQRTKDQNESNAGRLLAGNRLKSIRNEAQLIENQTNQIELNELRAYHDGLKTLASDLRATRTTNPATDRIESNGSIEEINLIESIRQSDCILDLSKTIQPHIDDLTSDHLVIVYAKLVNLCSRPRVKLKSDFRFYKEILTFKNSPFFQSLLDRTDHLDETLSIRCLLNALKLFYLLRLDSKCRAFNVVIRNLILRSDELTLNDEIPFFLKALDDYSNEKANLIDENFYSNLKNSLMRVAKNKIIHQFDLEEVDLIVDYLHLFQLNSDFEVVSQLSRQLLAPEIRFTYEQSVHLLKVLKLIRISNISTCEKEVEELATKCNRTIADTKRQYTRK